MRESDLAEGVLGVEGIFSHFAYADAPDHPTVRAQQETFVAILADAERAGLRIHEVPVDWTCPDCGVRDKLDFVVEAGAA